MTRLRFPRLKIVHTTRAVWYGIWHGLYCVIISEVRAWSSVSSLGQFGTFYHIHSWKDGRRGGTCILNGLVGFICRAVTPRKNLHNIYRYIYPYLVSYCLLYPSFFLPWEERRKRGRGEKEDLINLSTERERERERKGVALTCTTLSLSTTLHPFSLSLPLKWENLPTNEERERERHILERKGRKRI